MLIFRLPDEILASIFTHGARDYHEGNGHASFCVLDWVSVSYVCRHWRDAALDCPILWTYHFTMSLRWTEELMARSKQASLKIRIEYSSLGSRSWWSDLVEKVLNHAERIQDLRSDSGHAFSSMALLVCSPFADPGYFCYGPFRMDISDQLLGHPHLSTH